MSKYSYEEKLEAILRVLKEGMSLQASAKILGCSDSQVHRWVMQYEHFGPEGLTLKHGSYDGAFKISVVEYMQEHHLSAAQTAMRFGVLHDSVIRSWKRIYLEKGPQALFAKHSGKKLNMCSNKKKRRADNQTKEDLLAEVEQLRMENDYLKKLYALVQERIARENGKKPE